MPIYEYQCQACQREFEYQQRMADPDKTECEACGGALSRIISRTAFQLKGGGWYKDLYSSTKSDAGGGSAASGAGGAASSGASTGADSSTSASASSAAPASPSPAASSSSSGSGSGTSGGSGT